MTTDYLTPDEVASSLQVTRQVVYNWINDGRLRAVKAGRTLRIPPYALEAFLQPVHAGDISAEGFEPDDFLPVERFTPAAKGANIAVMSEVSTRHHIQAEVEHLLWVLLKQENGIVPQVLQRLGVDIHQVVRQSEQALANLPNDPTLQHSPEHLVISPRILNVLKRAEELANLKPDLQIDTSHILLAICEEPDGMSAQILHSFGITPDRLRIALSEVPGTYPVAASHEATHDQAAWEQRIQQQLTRIEAELAAIRSILAQSRI